MIKTADAEEDQLKLRNTVSAANYTHSVKEIDTPSVRDKNGAIDMMASPVFPIDPNASPIDNFMPIHQYAMTSGGTGAQAQVAGIAATVPPMYNQAPGSQYSIPLDFAIQAVINPVTQGMEGVRTPGKFGFAACTTVAATDVFTPTAGKKFRLLKAIICPDAGLAAAGVEVINFFEETLGTFLSLQIYLPIAASIVSHAPIVVDLTPNGYVSTTVTKKFQITLGTAVTAGAISVTFIGTEE